MGTATLYKDFLGIDYPGCHEVDVEVFYSGKDRHKRYHEVISLVETYPLFSPALWHPYYKGQRYLAQCISTQEWSKSDSETRARLDSLVKYRGKLAPPLFTSRHEQLTRHLDPKVPYAGSGIPSLKGASQIMETIDQLRLCCDERIRVIIWKFGEITNCKVRSLPLNTCRRKHIPRDWAGEDVTAGIGKLDLEDRSSC